jgi:hypothetical protein
MPGMAISGQTAIESRGSTRPSAIAAIGVANLPSDPRGPRGVPAHRPKKLPLSLLVHRKQSETPTASSTDWFTSPPHRDARRIDVQKTQSPSRLTLLVTGLPKAGPVDQRVRPQIAVAGCNLAHWPAGGCQSSTLFPSGSMTQANFPYSDSSIFSSTLQPSSRKTLTNP